MTDNLNFEASVEIDTSRADRETKTLTGSVDRLDSAIKRTGADIQKFASQTDALAKRENTASNARIKSAAKVSEAQVKYAAQAARAGVQYGSQIDSGIASTRYALYDVATTWGAVSAATLGSVVAAEKVGIAYESAFSGVERTSGTTGLALSKLSDELIGLSTSMPTTFQDLAQVATLGGQLGVDAKEIAGFTENVTMFSATTNASIDETATGFGRIAQLTGAQADSWDNIGSAIYKVGVNSVATETQIMNVAQEIATSGDLAGFSTAQIIGLAGALASLGVQPERARGNIQRIFAEINDASTEGGAKLQSFANLAGLTAEQFVSAWQNAPEKTFASLLSGLNDAAQGGADLTAVIKGLGVTAVRDVQTLQVLANNTDVYTQAQQDANTAYTDGTALLDGYGSVSEDTASILIELANTIKAIANEVSNLGALKGAANILKDMADVILRLVKTPVGGFLTPLILGFAGAVGTVAAFRAGTALLQASLLALRQAQAGLNSEVGVTDLRLRSLIKTLVTFTSSNRTAAASAGAAAEGIAAQGAAATTTSVGMNAASTATRGFTGALATLGKTTGILAAVSAALWAANWAISAISNSMESNKDKAAEFLGSFDGLGDALAKDANAAKEGGDVYRTVAGKIATATKSTPDWIASLEASTGAQADLSDATQTTTTSIQNQILAIGDSTEAWLAKSFTDSEKFQEIWRNYGTGLEEVGFKASDFLKASLAGGADDYIDTVINKLQTKYNALIDANNAATGGNNSLKIAIEYDKQAEALNNLRDVASGFNAELDTMANKQQLAAALTAGTGLTLEDLGLEASDAADSTSSLTDELTNLSNSAFASTDGIMAMQNLLYDLGGSLAANGTDFSVYTEAGRANMEALKQAVSSATTAAGGDAQLLAAYIAQISAALQGAGVDVATQLPQLGNLMKSLPPTFLSTAGAASLAGNALSNGYAAGATKAAKASKSASKSVKTLADYASDLSGVFNRAFDIRFGVDQAVDDVTKASQSLTKLRDDAQNNLSDAFDGLTDASQKVADLRVELQDLDATILGLNADRMVLEYQLTVANEYKDNLRAAEITADLAKNQADLADAENDRSKTANDLNTANAAVVTATNEILAAQEALQRTLSGSSESALEQRDAVLALVQAYQKQVTALASSGASQDTISRKTAALKAQFEDQMRQLGYNANEIKRYSAAFDDMTLAIGRVPRDITVTANTSPADQAIAEFLARNTNGNGASQTLTQTIRTQYDDEATKKAARGYKLQADIIAATAQLAKYGSNPSASTAISNQIAAWTAQLNSGNYAGGGFTGRGDKYAPAGVVHKGEYVVPKQMVNQSTGLPYADAFGAIARGYMSGGYVSAPSGIKMPSTLMVELSPTDRALLAANGNVTVTIDGRVIANAVNNSNTQNARRGAN